MNEMMEMSGDNAKQELIEMILSAGLLEDFLKYLREKNVNLDDVKSIYNIDEKLVREYALERKIVIEAEPELDSKDRIEEKYEPFGVKPRTPPRGDRLG